MKNSRRSASVARCSRQCSCAAAGLSLRAVLQLLMHWWCTFKLCCACARRYNAFTLSGWRFLAWETHFIQLARTIRRSIKLPQSKKLHCITRTCKTVIDASADCRFQLYIRALLGRSSLTCSASERASCHRPRSPYAALLLARMACLSFGDKRSA